MEAIKIEALKHLTRFGNSIFLAFVLSTLSDCSREVGADWVLEAEQDKNGSAKRVQIFTFHHSHGLQAIAPYKP